MTGEQEKALAQVVELVEAGRPFVMGTVDQAGKPQMRWMGGIARDPGCQTVGYLACASGSRKMLQLAANPAMQLMFHSEDMMCVATLEGVGREETDTAVKHQVWAAMPMLAEYFPGPDDPTFALVRFEARRVELLCMTGGPAPVSIDLI
jgi:general stress protein 26